MYAYQMDVAQPIEMYDRVRPEVERRVGGPLPSGCLMHMVTTTDEGFRVTEVWETQAACDRFGDEVMWKVIADVLGPEVSAAGPPPNQDLALHRLEQAR
ncbi:MAG: hypothetical protein M3Z02_01985 [Actinomycetota bacterium]|nr:hypothetical protein [Actinomycetota bacterium]